MTISVLYNGFQMKFSRVSKLAILLVVAVVMSASVAIGIWLGTTLLSNDDQDMLDPWSGEKSQPISYEPYSLLNLPNYPFATSMITVGEMIQQTENYREYLFTYNTFGQKMSGLLTTPANLDLITSQSPVVIMLRGWAPTENYISGIGTSPMARQLAMQGYLTLAPDFLGYGQSDPDLADTWLGRFIKPINVIELMKTVQSSGITGPDFKLNTNPPLGIWAHSNGGQIALSVLEIIQQPIPTVLWAPMTAPFPYSILYFGWEEEDEGKAQRKWISLFEDNHDVHQFSITQHIDKLIAPLQFHHGSADIAALQDWTTNFTQKIDIENQFRESQLDVNTSTTSGNTKQAINLSPIEYQYYKYQGADHNLRPLNNWNLAVQRSIDFFNKWLNKPG